MTSEPSVMDAAEQLRSTAQGAAHKFAHELDGGFQGLRKAVRSEVDSNPIRSVLIAAGIGYVLGGGMAAPMSRRLTRLAMRAMLLPLLEEPTARLWDWIRSDLSSAASATSTSPRQSNPSESTQEPSAAKGGKHHGN
jgi:hypothetical protein